MDSPDDQAANEKLKWLDDLYSGKGREFTPPAEGEQNEDFPFFDTRYHDLAAKWYRVRFHRDEDESSDGGGDNTGTL